MRLSIIALLSVVLLCCAGCSSWPFGSSAGDGNNESATRPNIQVTCNDAPALVTASPHGTSSPSSATTGSAAEGDRSGSGGAASTATEVLRRALAEAEAADAAAGR